MENQTQQQEAPAAETSEFFPSLSKPAAAPTTDSQESVTDWYIMEGVKGKGDRPSYFSPKYKTLVDQAKAYGELEKKLGATRTAPENYDISKYEELLDPQDMVTQKLLNMGRERHMSQEAMEGVLDVFSDYISSHQMDVSKEIEKLGPQGREKIQVVSQWIENTFSEKAINAINNLPKNADFVNFMDEVRQLQYHQNVNVPANESAVSKFIPLSVEEVEAEMKTNFNKYQNDPKYRAEIKAKFAQALGE